MESLEEFGATKVDNSQNGSNNDLVENAKKKNRKSIMDDFEKGSEKEKVNDELEYEYLKRFI